MLTSLRMRPHSPSTALYEPVEAWIHERVVDCAHGRVARHMAPFYSWAGKRRRAISTLDVPALRRIRRQIRSIKLGIEWVIEGRLNAD